mgnify:FL=1
MYQRRISIQTEGRGTYEISRQVAELVSESGIENGLCHVFIHHTSASLIITENADPSVRRDLDRFLERLIPDGDPMYEHALEGADDMPAHIRSVLTQSALSVPVANGRLALGAWQGIFLWEHRDKGTSRLVTVTVLGDGA